MAIPAKTGSSARYMLPIAHSGGVIFILVTCVAPAAAFPSDRAPHLWQSISSPELTWWRPALMTDIGISLCPQCQLAMTAKTAAQRAVCCRSRTTEALFSSWLPELL